MKQRFFTDKFMQALCRSYLVPCMLWSKEDEEFYAKNILPAFKRFMKDLLPRLKKCDGSVNDNLKEILVTCDNRGLYTPSHSEVSEIGAVITPRPVVAGRPVAGMVFGFTPKKIVLAGGIFGIDNGQAMKILSYIDEEKGKYKLLLENEDFVDSFGKEGFSRPNSIGYNNKDYGLAISGNFAGCLGEIPGRFITDDILPDIIIAHYKGIKVVNRFLNRALKPVNDTFEITV